MARPKHTIKILSSSEIEQIFESSLKILTDVGMKIDNGSFLKSLEENGSEVNYETKVVKFPEQMLRGVTAQIARESEAAQEKGVMLNSWKRQGHVWGGGPALYYLDYEDQQVRKGTAQDALSIIQLAEALPEVCDICATMLNYEADLDGKPFDPRLYTIKSTALTAQNTSKIAYAENIYSVRELEYLIEMGLVVHDGDMDSLKKNPTFSECKVVISPLRMERDSADILYFLARNGYRCVVASMAIAGMCAPVTLAGVIAQANAEILGSFAAIKAVNPKAPCGAVWYLGNMDMREPNLVYGTPEVLLLQVAAHEVGEYFYKFPPSTRTLYIDAKLPGYQAAFERGIYYFSNLANDRGAGGSFGFLNRGQVISCEQALLDLEATAWMDKYQQGFNVDEESLALDVIGQVGIGGDFIATEHTAEHFRKGHWMSDLFDRKKTDLSFERYTDDDALTQANKKVKKLLKEHQPFTLDKYKSEEIDRIVKEAERELVRE